MRVRRIHILAAVVFVAVCCTPAGGPARRDWPQPAGWTGPGQVPPPQRMKLWFGGDVMQHMPQVEAARCGERFDYRPVFAALAPRMRAADLTVVNLETTLTAAVTRVTRCSGRRWRWPTPCAMRVWMSPCWPTTIAATEAPKASARRWPNWTAAEYSIRAYSQTALTTRRIIRFT